MYPEELDGLVWSLVRRHLSKNCLDGRLNRTKDDLYSLAREAALIAFGQYQSDKNAKMSTWITRCVLQALSRNRKWEKSRVTLDESIFEEDVPSFNQEEIEFDITMRQILTAEEYAVFRHRFVADESEEEIAMNLGITRARVKKCLHHILHRYQLIERSQIQVMTDRRRQDNWLNSSSP